MATQTDESPETAAPLPEKPRRSGWKELPVLLLISLALALLIKTFLVQAFFIPSASMEPTLVKGDRVLVSKVIYHVRDIHRGDVIVFENPHPEQLPHRNAIQGFVHWLTDGLGFTQPENEDFIKRVIGLPGDTVEGRDGRVYVNDKPLDEPWLPAGTTTQPFRQFHVPANSLFVMGDNRGNSLDSRFGLGYVPFEKVIGEAFVIIWPPSHIGSLG